MTRERSIIMRADEVRAILAGCKTQFRATCDRANTGGPAASVHKDGAGTGWIAWWPSPVSAEETRVRYPGADGFRPRYGNAGDRLWVRETWAWGGMGIPYVYRVDGERDPHNGGTKEHGYAARIGALEAALGGVLVPVEGRRMRELQKRILRAVNDERES